MKKFLFILNPIAGKGRGERIFPKLKDSSLLRSKKAEIVITEDRGHAKEISKLNRNDYDVIVAVGGDGTVHEIVNGLGADSKAVFAVLPIGSGNDYARTALMSSSFSQNLEIILDHRITNELDLGYVKILKSDGQTFTEHHFINSLGIGFDALVSYLSQQNNFLTGLPLYLWSVFKALFHYRPLNLSGTLDANELRGKKLLIAIGNGKTAGGGFYLNPSALADDGYLDACIAEFMSPLKIFTVLPKAISGNHVNLPEIFCAKFKKAEFELMDPAYVHSDGEVLAVDALKLEVRLADEKIKVLLNKLRSE